MIGGGLKKLAADYDLTVEQGVAYGWLKGCYVTFSEGMGNKRLSLYVGSHHAGMDSQEDRQEGQLPAAMATADRICDLILAQAGDDKKYRLMPTGKGMAAVIITQGGSAVIVNFLDTIGTLSCVRAFIEDVLPQVAPLTTPKACTLCGLETDSASLPVLLGGSVAVPMHSHCAEQMNLAIEQKASQEKHTFFLLPLLGALLGALIGALLWTGVGILGYMASLVGLVIAFLAAKGFSLLGGKPGKLMVITLLVCVILAVALGNLGTVVYQLHEIYQEGVADLKPWEEAVPKMEFIDNVLPDVWADAEMRSELVKDFLVGLLFAALGSFGTIVASGKKDAAHQKPKALQGRL